ncbi:MAG: DUF3854 domain-containing protein [Cyanobacteriota bacterium]|nr:DUF3854 domain-containing protein [Cyanobacteriota bacterium]
MTATATELCPDGVAVADPVATLEWFRHELAAAAPAEPWAGCRDAIAHLERSLAQPAAQRLSPEHRAKLASSALNDNQIEALLAAGIRTDGMGRLIFPYRNPDGTPQTLPDGAPWMRCRQSEAKLKADPDAPKYLSVRGGGCRLYHPHLAIAAGNYQQRLSDRFTALRITEGELKAEAAAAHDAKRVTIGLGGVNSWRDHRSGGEDSAPLPELVALPLDGREVRLCFDSDHEKPQVAAALRELAEWLADRGAHVLIEVLPNGLDGQRLGLDDLIRRHGADVFHGVASIARHPFRYRRRNGEEERIWAFDPQPQDTRERNTYLAGMLGAQWRSSPDARDAWQRWSGTHWEAVAGDDHLAGAVERFMVLQCWRNRELATMRSLLAAFRRSIAPAAEDAAAGLLPFRNGCLRLADGALLPHNPDNGNTWALPYDYDPQATCSGIEAFLGDRLGDPASVAVFRAFARALLVGDRLKSFIEITGPSNTGKSVLASLLVALVGSSNTAAGTLQRIEDRTQRFETLKLRGKRLAVFSECQDFAGQLQVLKALTGGDPIGAEIKGGRHLDFVFTGGVVLVGNGPIRATDPTGAVINRRRSLPVQKVVSASAERQLLDPDGHGGWRGELACELPGLVNWCLAMPAAEARTALARDVRSMARAEAELETLIGTDLLAEWADQCLAWHEGGRVRVGHADEDADQFTYPNYLRWLERQGRNCRPLALRSFKGKLIDLLRDTLALPLPPGSTNSGEYRVRGVGSVIPCLRLRWSTEEEPGVIRHAFMARIDAPQAERIEPEAERVGNGKTPVGNGWNGWNGSEQLPHIGENREQIDTASIPYRAVGGAKSVPAVPSVPQKGSQRSASVPAPPVSVPQGIRTAAGWVELALAELRLAPHLRVLPEVMAWLRAHPAAPAISQREAATALERLHREEVQADQPDLLSLEADR